MRVNISSAVAEKGGGKVGCVAIHDCYSPLLHTLSWTVEENTCLGEEVLDPGCWRCTSACRVHLWMIRRKVTHQRVRHVDEMALYHPS